MTSVSGFLAVGSRVADGVLVEFPSATGLSRVPAIWSVPAAGTVDLLGGAVLGPIEQAPQAPIGAAGLFAGEDDPTPVLAFTLAAALPGEGAYVIVPAGGVLSITPVPGVDALTVNSAPVTIAGVQVQVT